jgi:hypothetical protein
MSKKVKDDQEDLRVEERNTLELPSMVELHDEGETRTETAMVTSISRNGAGFSVSCPCTVGRLLKLLIPMPTEFRTYDEDEDLYPVMGLVQHCNQVTNDGENVYHVGVALIGRQVPESFEEDPLQNYRINGMTEDGLWSVTEADAAFMTRKNPRFSIALDVTLSLIRPDKRLISKEVTVTQNISAGGVSVESHLNAHVGDKVKFACEAFKFYTIASVRNRKAGKPRTLHLEFIENRFPVEKIPNIQIPEEGSGRYNEVVETDTPQVAADLGNFEFNGISL